MHSKLNLLAVSLLIAYSIGSSYGNDENAEASHEIYCDGFFKNVGKIRSEHVDEFQLGKEYANRNQNLKSCLDFYVRYLAKIDFDLHGVDYSDLFSSNSEMMLSNENLSGERLKRKSSYRKKPHKVNKAF